MNAAERANLRALLEQAIYRVDINDIRHPAARLIAAAVNALPGLLDALDRAETPWSKCTGAGDCPESWHVHGCFADLGKCDDPLEHHAWMAES